MDLYDSSDYEKFPASVHLKARRTILEMNPPFFSFQDQTAIDIKDIQSRRTSWYELWRLTFLELNRCQPCEMQSFCRLRAFEGASGWMLFPSRKPPHRRRQRYARSSNGQAWGAPRLLPMPWEPMGHRLYHTPQDLSGENRLRPLRT